MQHAVRETEELAELAGRKAQRVDPQLAELRLEQLSSSSRDVIESGDTSSRANRNIVARNDEEIISVSLEKRP